GNHPSLRQVPVHVLRRIVWSSICSRPELSTWVTRGICAPASPGGPGNTCFRELTGVPIGAQRLFNENEPVVCEPREALECFLRTRMDVLVMGDNIVYRHNAK